jgi:hypothetical protein
MIASEDLDALDEFESMLQTLAARAPTGREYTVFYLKFARAEVAAELLNEMLAGGSGGDAGGGEAGGGLMGDLASGLLGDAGGGLFGSLLGLGGGGGGGAISTSGTVTLVADRRLNALVVQANAADLDIVEQLLEVIDQEASPEDVQTVAKPRLIPVFYTSAEEIANVVRQVYASRIAGGGASQQQRQPSPEEFIQALRGGGRGGRGGRSSGSSAQDQEQSMTVGVDTRSNSIVIAAPEPLFQEVRLLVEQLDQAGAEEAETMRVVTLKSASPELVQRAIVSITGGKVTTNTSTNGQSSSTSRSSDSRSSRSRGSSNDSSRQPTPEQFQEQVRQRIEMFNQMQRGAGGDQGGGRGSRGGDAQGGGGFQLPTGGSPFGGGRTGGGRRGGR